MKLRLERQGCGTELMGRWKVGLLREMVVKEQEAGRATPTLLFRGTLLSDEQELSTLRLRLEDHVMVLYPVSWSFWPICTLTNRYSALQSPLLPRRFQLRLILRGWCPLLHKSMLNNKVHKPFRMWRKLLLHHRLIMGLETFYMMQVSLLI